MRVRRWPGVPLLQLARFSVADDLQHPARVGEDVLQLRDELDDRDVLVLDLLALERGEAAQLHLEDGVGLDLAEREALHEVLRGRSRRPLTHGWSRMTSSRLSSAILRPSRMWARSRAFWRSYSVRLTMTSRRQSIWCWRIGLRRQRLWLPVDERDDVGVEGHLERGVLEQVVEHLVRVGVPLALDDDAHAVAVGLITQVGDAVDLAALDQVGDLLQQGRLVDLVGQLGGHDGGATLAGLLERALGRITTRPRPWAYMSRMASIRSRWPVMGLRRSSYRKIVPPVGKSGPRMCSQRSAVVSSGSSMSALVARDDLAQVVRRDVGRHAHRDAGGAVDEQVGQLRGSTDGCIRVPS